MPRPTKPAPHLKTGPEATPGPFFYGLSDSRVEPGGENMILPAAIDHQVIPGIALPLKAKALEQGAAAQGN